MAIDIDLLNRKLSLVDRNGNTIIDLTTASIRYADSAPRVLKLVQVGEDVRMRPDVISRLYYGTENYIGHLLKFNAISNPFAMNTGDILAIPDIAGMEASLANPSDGANQRSVRDQFIDENKVRESDNTRQELERKLNDLRKKGAGVMASPSNLPPNIADVGDAEFKVRGGKIYFGPDVSKPASACEEPLSKAELRSRLMKNRLK